MFTFGVKDISIKGDKIFICLTYTPRHQNLKKKFGDLPIQYIRTKMFDKEKDLKLFETALKRFNFKIRLDEEEEEEFQQQQQQIESGPSRKKVKVSQPESSLLESRISLDSEEGDDVVNTQRTHKKSLSVLVEDDDDDIFSQKF
ncbi:glutamic acid-rich protein-like [Sitophilus oryzae]|uniref:Glutamic acid-rich protein-like n=1 Tax=Sitophilus oryzae TaxID=7048 RepID=A0A6J2XVT3_SITOR|nr:glutamic acid-rich protein-like [Sitophilus oryzae]